MLLKRKGMGKLALIEELSKEELESRAQELRGQYEEYKAMGLQLNMARGKPGPEQLDLTMDLLNCVDTRSGAVSENGEDARNYGMLDGIPEAKRLFGQVLEMDPVKK